MSANTETWTNDGARLIALDYDERGVCHVTREAMHAILELAGFFETSIPDVPPPTESGRSRLKRVARAIEEDR